MVDVAETKDKSVDLREVVDVADTKDKSIDLEEPVRSDNVKRKVIYHFVSTPEIIEPVVVPVVEKKRKVGRPKKQKKVVENDFVKEEAESVISKVDDEEEKVKVVRPERIKGVDSLEKFESAKNEDDGIGTAQEENCGANDMERVEEKRTTEGGIEADIDAGRKKKENDEKLEKGFDELISMMENDVADKKVDVAKTEVQTKRRRGRPWKVKPERTKLVESQKAVRQSDSLEEERNKLDVKFKYTPEDGKTKLLKKFYTNGATGEMSE